MPVRPSGSVALRINSIDMRSSPTGAKSPSAHRGSGFAGTLVWPLVEAGAEGASGVTHFVPKMRSPASPRPGTM